MLKKFLMASLTLMLSLMIVGCNQTKDEGKETQEPATTEDEQQTSEPATEEAKYDDGIYYAEADEYHNDWKYAVTIEVKDGKISAAEWNGVNINGGKDKITLSTDGEYPMVEAGGAQAEWHDQAKLVEDYLLETQDPTDITYTNDEGNTDDIAGVTIKVANYFELAEKALNNGPIEKGQYKDGFYYAQNPEFSKGFKYFAHIAVKNGTIVGVDFNGIPEEEDAPDKDTLSKSGEYGMKEAGAQSEWHEQADLAEEYLLETQDPTDITYTNDEGQTDDIAGVTIKVKDFFTLAEQALADAK